MPDRLQHVAIVGGGASGVLMAAHLLRRADGLHVTLVERGDRLGAGIAYGTEHVDHLLNVRAGNMSAFADRPDHFWEWLSGRPELRRLCPDRQSFAPRRIYRDYLDAVMRLAAGAPAPDRLTIVHGEAVEMHETAGGVVVELRDGRRIEADVAVLATGNEAMPLPTQGRRFDGWNNHAAAGLAKDAAIAIIGTGLTMTDQVLTLRHAGHRGPITAISRRGLTHQPHRPVEAETIPAAAIPIGAPLSRFCQWLRREVRTREAAGTDWRGVIDALRPHTQAIWRGFSRADRHRFLRHARPWWDVHRHRMAPQAREVLDEAMAAGTLRVMPARVLGFAETPAAIEVKLVKRGSDRPEVLSFDAVLECRGRAATVATTENPLLHRLLTAGHARPDEMGIGIDVTEDCAVLDATGQRSQRIYGIGPVTAGTFWEIVAIPDIRVQAAALADRLLAATRP